MASNIQFSHQVRRIITWVVMAPKRARFSWTHRAHLDASDKVVVSVRKLCARSREMGMENLACVHNASLFVLLLDQDFHWLRTQMMQALDEPERMFVARQIALLLFEASEDLPQVFGRDYREALAALHFGQKVLPELDAIMKGVNKFKREHAAALKQIRTLVVAHREQDALVQLEALEGVRPLSLMELAAEFYVSLRSLTDLLVKVTLMTADIGVFARDYLKKAKADLP